MATEALAVTDSQCPGCEHPNARHYHAVDGTTRCLVVESGTSTSGVIGLPWSRSCDCCNGVSKYLAAQRKYEADERAQRDGWMMELRDQILARLPAASVSVPEAPSDGN